ncbi:MAG: hypothetical protein A2V93_02690 [Ignavibacteria bacterium RBG_16_34_14]|nr:MAG: hypothetical protein A2V93_02690 [Ignavibacteria bacterium RBG_16_34_14]
MVRYYIVLFNLSIFYSLVYSQEIGLGIKVTGISNFDYNVSNFPLNVRAIPRHIDDDWIEGLYYSDNILSDTTLYAKSALTSFTNLFVSFSNVLRIGVSIISPSINEPTRYSQNQNGNNDRGYGASLRYYELRDPSVNIGIYTSLGIPITVYKHDAKYKDEDEIRIGFKPMIEGVYQIFDSDLQTESGWDRFGSDEIWQDHSIGRIKQHLISIALELSILSRKINTDFSYGLILSIGYARTFVEFKNTDNINYTSTGKQREAIIIGLGLIFIF